MDRRCKCKTFFNQQKSIGNPQQRRLYLSPGQAERPLAPLMQTLLLVNPLPKTRMHSFELMIGFSMNSRRDDGAPEKFSMETQQLMQSISPQMREFRNHTSFRCSPTSQPSTPVRQINVDERFWCELDWLQFR